MPVLLEFTVEGSPVSHQTLTKENLRVWKETVRKEAARHWNGRELLTRPVKFIVMSFCEESRLSPDDDNMVKPIRDALNKVVYQDDKQITHAAHSRTSIDAYFRIRGVSNVILEAFSRGKEFVYIRIEEAPQYTDLPPQGELSTFRSSAPADRNGEDLRETDSLSSLEPLTGADE